jgi:hypothetical protein
MKTLLPVWRVRSWTRPALVLLGLLGALSQVGCVHPLAIEPSVGVSVHGGYGPVVAVQPVQPVFVGQVGHGHGHGYGYGYGYGYQHGYAHPYRHWTRPVVVPVPRVIHVPVPRVVPAPPPPQVIPAPPPRFVPAPPRFVPTPPVWRRGPGMGHGG